MNALDRYLKAVKQFLPRARQDEILRELSENLRSQMKGREAELGRPLNEAEREAILDRHGSPLLVAGRYRQHAHRLAIGGELIGPELFPHYVRWLSIPIGITTVLFAVALALGERPPLGQFLFPVGVQFACVTLIFILGQVWQNKYGWLGRWKSPSPPAAELIRRYLHAVRFWLPKGQQEDILAELAEDLRSKIEDREAELGRKLDEGELVAILKQRGEPKSVAAGYLPPQYLIGPVLFPLYRFVLKLVVLWILLPLYIVVAGPIVVRTAVDPSLAGIQALWSCLMSAGFTVGVITIVFAFMERRPQASLSEWDPRRLPAVPARKPWANLEPMTWYRAVASIVFGALFGLVWVYMAQPRTAVYFAGVRIALAPVWRSVFWPILAVLLSGVVVGVAGLLRPQSARLHAAIRLAANALSLVVVGVLLNAHTWVEIAAPGLPRAAVQDSAGWTNLGLWIALLSVGIIVLADTVREALRVFRKNAPLNGLAGRVSPTD
ncbi:MAG: hypothetical protein ABSD27_00435 [Bryobacteraceae bacterium]|jgi:hypothetical protein